MLCSIFFLAPSVLRLTINLQGQGLSSESNVPLFCQYLWRVLCHRAGSQFIFCFLSLSVSVHLWRWQTSHSPTGEEITACNPYTNTDTQTLVHSIEKLRPEEIYPNWYSKDFTKKLHWLILLSMCPITSIFSRSLPPYFLPVYLISVNTDSFSFVVLFHRWTFSLLLSRIINSLNRSGTLAGR